MQGAARWKGGNEHHDIMSDKLRPARLTGPIQAQIHHDSGCKRLRAQRLKPR